VGSHWVFVVLVQKISSFKCSNWWCCLPHCRYHHRGQWVVKAVRFVGASFAELYLAYCDAMRAMHRRLRGFTTWCDYRPQWCQKLLACHRRVCGCQECINGDLCAEALAAIQHQPAATIQHRPAASQPSRPSPTP